MIENCLFFVEWSKLMILIIFLATAVMATVAITTDILTKYHAEIY